MTITFRLSPYDRDALRAPLTDALMRIAECMSRERNPGAWRFADRVTVGGRASAPDEKTLRRRNIRYRIYGIVLIAMGLFCLIPGLVKPAEMTGVLIAGIAGCAAGVFYLVRSRQKLPYDKLAASAELLLDQLEGVYSSPADGPVEIRVTNRGLVFADAAPIPFEQFNYAVENEDLIVILWGETVHYAVLPKADLHEGTIPGLRGLLQRNVASPGTRLSLWQGDE